MPQVDQGTFHCDYPIPQLDASFLQGLTDAWRREFAKANKRTPTDAETTAATAEMKTAAEARLKQIHDGDSAPTRVFSANAGLNFAATDINGFLVAHAGETVTSEGINLELRPEQFDAFMTGRAAKPGDGALCVVNIAILHTVALAIAKASGRTGGQLDGLAEEMGHYKVTFGGAPPAG